MKIVVYKIQRKDRRQAHHATLEAIAKMLQETIQVNESKLDAGYVKEIDGQERKPEASD